MNIRLRSALLNLTLLGASIVFVLILAEGFLRLFPSYLPEEARLRIHWTGLGKPKVVGHP